LATLISSSSAGQWMPRPPPSSRHSPCSLTEPCASRGYQASGAAMVRPSASSTERVSSPTSTWASRPWRSSTVEGFIPAVRYLLPMLLDQLVDAVDFFPAEAATALEPDRVEPEFRLAVVSFDMDVRRLTPIAGIEEEPKWTHAEYGRHATMLPAQG